MEEGQTTVKGLISDEDLKVLLANATPEQAVVFSQLLANSSWFDSVLNPEVISPIKKLRSWAFVLCFLCIGLSTRFAELAHFGLKPFWAFTIGVIVNVPLGIILSAVVFSDYWMKICLSNNKEVESMSKSDTPLLDELEGGKWPSFVNDMKQAAEKKPMAKDLLRQLELSYEDKIGHWKHGGIVGVLGYGGGVIGRYSDLPDEFPDVRPSTPCASTSRPGGSTPPKRCASCATSGTSTAAG